MNRVHFSSVSDNWSTPEYLYKILDEEFQFNFDPCPSGAKFNGLLIDWGSSTFCNPPYSALSKWLEKGFVESQKGKTVVMLIPSRTDTKAFHEFAMKGEIRFLRGRLKFNGAKHNAPFPSCVVVFSGSAQ